MDDKSIFRRPVSQQMDPKNYGRDNCNNNTEQLFSISLAFYQHSFHKELYIFPMRERESIPESRRVFCGSFYAREAHDIHAAES